MANGAATACSTPPPASRPAAGRRGAGVHLGQVHPLLKLGRHPAGVLEVCERRGAPGERESRAERHGELRVNHVGDGFLALQGPADQAHPAAEHAAVDSREALDAPAAYGLRDPSFDERRVLFELDVVKVATFGRP